jgi:hypothetical protein
MDQLTTIFLSVCLSVSLYICGSTAICLTLAAFSVS